MTRDDIIRMAREAGLPIFDAVAVAQDPAEQAMADVVTQVWHNATERFAALVAAAEREAVLDTIDALMGGERETNNMFSEGYDYALGQIEEFVRARGETK